VSEVSKKRYQYSGHFSQEKERGWGKLQSINPKISGMMFPTLFNAMNSKEWVEGIH